MAEHAEREGTTEQRRRELPWWGILGALALVVLWMTWHPAAEPVGPRIASPPPAAGVDQHAYDLNMVWTLTAALCVYVMHGGFGFFEAGMTRRESTVTTLTHNLMVLAVTAVVYWAVGFGVMYGAGPALAGTHGYFPTLLDASMGNYPALTAKPVPLVAAFAFAMAFSDTPATLVAGAAAERLKLSGFMILTALIGSLFFPLVGRAVWGGGILSTMAVPFYDAGAATIQLCGGLFAGVVCWRLGPRAGRFNADGTANRMPSSSMPLVFLGVFILWMGFIAFNAGGAMSVTPSIALVIVDTAVGSLAGAAVALVSVWVQRGKGSLRAALMGLLTASVAVTSISAVVEPWAAVLTGLVAGALTPPCISLVARLGLDDPTEYLTMNVFGGVWGTLAVGIFASPMVASRVGTRPMPQPGLWYGGMDQMVSQLVGLAAITAFVVPVMLASVLVLERVGMLRVSPEEERVGSDEYSHGEQGYEGFAWDDGRHDGEQPSPAGRVVSASDAAPG